MQTNKMSINKLFKHSTYDKITIINGIDQVIYLEAFYREFTMTTLKHKCTFIFFTVKQCYTQFSLCSIEYTDAIHKSKAQIQVMYTIHIHHVRRIEELRNNRTEE